MLTSTVTDQDYYDPSQRTVQTMSIDT